MKQESQPSPPSPPSRRIPLEAARAAQEALVNAQENRRLMMWQAMEAGASMRQIAQAVGISYQRVYQILDAERRYRRDTAS